jgi:hypothetical protein
METDIQDTADLRVSWETLLSQMEIVKCNLTFNELSTAKNDNVFVLNLHKQIVFITRSCLNLFNIEDPATVYGCRSGEMMCCTHAQANGCGASAACQLCAARNAALSCLNGQTVSSPFKLIQAGSKSAIQFMMNARPVTLKGQLFLMISLIQA